MIANAAGRKGIERKARLAGNGPALAKRRNAAGDPFPACPKGAPHRRPCGVAALAKGWAIDCGRRLA